VQWETIETAFLQGVSRAVNDYCRTSTGHYETCCSGPPPRSVHSLTEDTTNSPGVGYMGVILSLAYMDIIMSIGHIEVFRYFSVCNTDRYYSVPSCMYTNLGEIT